MVLNGSPISVLIFRIYNDEELSDEADAAVVFGANDEGVDTLVLDPVHRGQTGEYLCSVTNSIGEAPSHPVYIDVQCKFKWNKK